MIRNVSIQTLIRDPKATSGVSDNPGSAPGFPSPHSKFQGASPLLHLITHPYVADRLAILQFQFQFHLTLTAIDHHKVIECRVPEALFIPQVELGPEVTCMATVRVACGSKGHVVDEHCT